MKRTFILFSCLVLFSFSSYSQPWPTFIAGITWHDHQYNAGGARMIGNDPDGWVHIVWTQLFNNYWRYAYYNVWDPDSEAFVYSSEGTQISASMRSGYATLVVDNDGRCYPVFHQVTGIDFHPAISIDFLPRTGSFVTYEYFGIGLHDMGWPRVDIDTTTQVLHVLAAASGDNFQYALYHLRFIPVFDDYGFGQTFELIENSVQFVDSISILAYDIAVTRSEGVSRVAITWAKPKHGSEYRYDNDLVYKVSNNNGATFWPEVNVTQFIEPDWECLSGDTMACNRDTFRVHADISAIFDDDENLHIAFSTTNYYALQSRMARYAGQLWHWSEADDEVTPIHAVGEDYTSPNWALDIGDLELVLQDPCLTLDRTTDDLFCTYSFCDTNQWSQVGIPQGDIWVSRSTDNGQTWSLGTNITQTDGGQETPAGECLDESFSTAARFIRYYNSEAYLDVGYILDLDAGTSIGEVPISQPTPNPVQFTCVLIDSIPSEPLWDPDWPQLHVDTTETISAQRESITNLYALHQNYPNPFNATTTIRYDLPQTSTVTLTVYNIVGQKVAQPILSSRMSAGTHSLEYDASSLSSGLYFYQLETDKQLLSRKMMLLK